MEANKNLDRIIELESRLHGIERENLNVGPRNQSRKINELATAFSKAQGEFAVIGHNRANPYFKSKYADLDAILKAVRPALVKYGLSFYQYTSIDNGSTVLHSRILHSSGQWLESQIKITPPKNDIQSYGSTMSYQRRYSAITLLGVTTTDDPSDDDGTTVTPQKINGSQWNALTKELKIKPSLIPAILKKFDLKSISDMQQSDFSTVMNIVRKFEEKQ